MVGAGAELVYKEERTFEEALGRARRRDAGDIDKAARTWSSVLRRQKKKPPHRRAVGRAESLELLGIHEPSSSCQSWQRRSGRRVLEVHLENLPLEVKEVAFCFGGRLEDSRFG